MNIPAKSGTSRADVVESVLIKGDLALLSEQERVNYYMRVCESLGLNPLTRPFEYIKFQGKLILYARKDCTDQLRKKDGISIKLLSQSVANDVLTVHAQATLYESGRERTDEDVGTLACPPGMKGEALAIATMKAVTKAKRRVTLSICGLGMLDESELPDSQADRTPAAPAPNVLVSPPPPPSVAHRAAGAPASSGPHPPDEDAGALLLAQARQAAEMGEAAFQFFYKNRSEAEKDALTPYGAELRQLMNG